MTFSYCLGWGSIFLSPNHLASMSWPGIFGVLTFEDGADKLPRAVGKELQLLAANSPE